MNYIIDKLLFVFFFVVIWLVLFYVFFVDVYSFFVNYFSYFYGNFFWCLLSKGCEVIWEDVYKI